MFKDTLVSKYFLTARITTTTTCAQLRGLQGGVTILGIDQLGKLSKEEFKLCETFLGNYNWTSDRATALAKIAIAVRLNFKNNYFSYYK